MRKLFLVSAVLIVMGALAVIGCSKQKEVTEIRVGCVQAQTGMFAAFGQGGVFGVKAAVDDVNKQGGVNVGGKKMPIKLIVVDDESDPNKAGSLAESLIVQDKVNFICTGDEPPPMHVGVSQAADRHKVPYVTSVGPFEPWMGMRQESPAKWPYTWATGLFAIVEPPKDGSPGYTIMDVWMGMLDLYGGKTNKNVGLIASDEPDGRGWYTLFGPALKKAGYNVLGIDKNLGLMPLETTDFSSVIKQWKDAKVEILWGNCPGPYFGAFWKQANSLGFKPKMAFIGRAALFQTDIAAWGSDLPLAIGTDMWWDPSLKDSPGIGGATPKSLAEKWVTEAKQPFNPAVLLGYRGVQVLVDAIQRAGTLDPEKVNAALAQTDLQTILYKVKFDENHFSRGPLVFGQWFKTDKPEKWELKVVLSKHNFVSATDKPIFPRP